MTDDLGLSELADDQLLELGRAILREIAKRGPEASSIIYDAMIEERDRLLQMRDGAALAIAAELDRQRREAQAEGAAYAEQKMAIDRTAKSVELQAKRAEQEAELARAKWQPVATICAMVTDLLGPGWIVERWVRDGDLRVYLTGPDCQKLDTRYGIKKTGSFVEYFKTGNSRVPPGKLVLSKCDAPRAAVKVLCEIIAKAPIEKANCAEVAECGIPPGPFHPEYTAVRHGK